MSIIAQPSAAPTTAELLKAAAKKAPAPAAKGTTPAVNVPELQGQLSELVEVWRQQQDLEAREGLLRAAILPVAEQHRSDLARQGKSVSSVKLNGMVLYVCQNKYSKVDAAIEEPLRAQLGDRFGQCFVTETETKVDVTKLTPELTAALLEAGALTVTEHLKTTEYFHHARDLDRTVAAVAAAHNIKPVAYLR